MNRMVNPVYQPNCACCVRFQANTSNCRRRLRLLLHHNFSHANSGQLPPLFLSSRIIHDTYEEDRLKK